MNKIFDITHAIPVLAPNSQWVMRGTEYSELEWLSTDIEKPTEEALLAEVARQQAEWDALEYQRLRSLEYPDFRDYLDGIVKGDQDQIQAYIDACQAVKAKYPKPE